MLALPEGYLRGFSIVVAHDAKLGIGKSDGIPWFIPEDLRRFKDITTALRADNYKPAIVMGMNTWYSLREKVLPGRVNVVLSKRYREIPEVESYNDVNSALDTLCRSVRCGNVFIIGGGQIYKLAMEHPALTTVYATEVKCDFKCDVVIPEYRDRGFEVTDKSTWLKSAKGDYQYRFITYQRE